MLKEEDAKMPAYQPEAKTITFNPVKKQVFYWAAAAILLLLVPVFIIMRNNTSEEQLFSQYFSPHQNQWVPVTGDTADLPTQAMKHYEKQNYALALPILEKILGTGTDTAEAEVQFYKGNSHLALNHTKEAISCFETILAMPANQYTEEAQWYLALSYIKADDKKKARQTLKEIVAEQNHPYNKDAQQLLNKF
jgi:FimV-like protein